MSHYGFVPWKLTCQREDQRLALRKNRVLNYEMSLRPIYLIREKETNQENF